jgi:hypothetical protein
MGEARREPLTDTGLTLLELLIDGRGRDFVEAVRMMGVEVAGAREIMRYHRRRLCAYCGQEREADRALCIGCREP